MNSKMILPLVVLSLASSNVLAQMSNSSVTTGNAAQNNTQNMQSNAAQNQQQMSAIDIILKDHEQIKKMLSQINKTLDSNVAQSRSNFMSLKNFLINHETMEEQVWYPALAQYKDLKDVITKLKQEEQDASAEIAKLDAMNDDKQWAEGVKKFGKAVEQHAKDEETLLFSKVKKELNDNMLKQIGGQLQDYKKQNPVSQG